MARSQSRVKVQTDKLLEAVKARRAKQIATHAKALEKYERDRAAYEGKVVDALRKALAQAEAGKLPTHEHGYRSKYLQVPVRFEHPSKPSSCTSSLDRLISTLEIAADPTITISAEDAAQYLG